MHDDRSQLRVPSKNASFAAPAPDAPPLPPEPETHRTPAPPGLPATQETAFAPGVTVAGYEILQVLGQGGMGVVYKARQTCLDRLVAVKVIRADLAETDPGALARFRAEAQAVAQLQAPNIVAIYEIGVHAGRPFLALEYVEGGTLAEKLKATLPPLRQAAHLAATLARAVHAVHEHGIIHRDLKPGNILLTAAGEPKIADFGLAKYLDRNTGAASLTATGELLGTPCYMAPEQAAGENRLLGPAADVYALGAMLYHMMTGRPPLEGETPLETVELVVSTDPAPPRQVRPRVPPDLETICLTCLQKDPAKRYASAGALANDLSQFLAGRPIQARPPSRRERLGRWLRRHPAAAALVALSAAAALGLLVGALWLHALAVSALAIGCVVAGAGWYAVRLRAALREARGERRRAERGIERLHLLLEATQQLMSAATLQDILRLLSETISRMADAERASIFLVDRARGELWSKVALGAEEEIRVPLGQGIVGAVAATGQTINLADPYADHRFHADVDRRTGFVTRNLLTVPMSGRGGDILGVFQVLNKRGGAFTSDDADILVALAASAARAVEGVDNALRENVATLKT